MERGERGMQLRGVDWTKSTQCYDNKGERGERAADINSKG